MNIWANNEELNIPPEDLHVVEYSNDMLNGMLIDLGDQYGFVSRNDPERSPLIEGAIEEGAVEYDLTDIEVDFEENPHSWVVNSVGKLIIEAAEDTCKDALDRPPLMGRDMRLEDLLDKLYERRKYALDPECTWNVRRDAWKDIDVLLDRFNELKNAEHTEHRY